MKKLLFTIFLLFIMGCTQVSTWDIYRFDGISAFATTMVTQEVSTQCDCKGTGKVSTDGKIDMPCQCGPNCKCPKVGKKVVKALYFHVENCIPCRRMEKELNILKKSGWQIGDSKTPGHIQFCNDTEKYQVTEFPTTIFMVDDKEISRSVGVIKAKDFAVRFNSLNAGNN